MNSMQPSTPRSTAIIAFVFSSSHLSQTIRLITDTVYHEPYRQVINVNANQQEIWRMYGTHQAHARAKGASYEMIMVTCRSSSATWEYKTE